MYETNKAKQINEIYDNMVKILSKSNDSKMIDTMFSDGSFSLKSLSDNKAIFIADSATNAQIFKVITPQVKDALYQIMGINYEVDVSDKASYLKKLNSINEVNTVFFKNSHIHPEFTFDNFVMGPSNKNAYLASLFCVENPGKTNPIFLYSKSGLGKTHLLQAIGNAYSEKNPENKVLYITSEEFISEFIKYVKGNKDSESLKDFFLTVDLLLIDDIQLFVGKEETQTMFFNIFNLLVSSNKQIVITSDKSPNDLKGLQERLVSRFSGGLSISIGTPNKETLIEILKKKIVNNGLSLDFFEPTVFDYLASNYNHSVRELEGALTNLLFANTCEGNKENIITLAFTKEVFEADEIKRSNKGKADADTVIKVVADYYSLSENQIKSKIRTAQIALARQISMYLCRDYLSLPYQEIGKKFNKDHSTVLSNVKKIQNNFSKDPILKSTIETLQSQLKSI